MTARVRMTARAWAYEFKRLSGRAQRAIIAG